MRTLLFLFFACTMTPLDAQNGTEMPLYPGAVPNSVPFENLEKTEINQWGVSFTTATSVPTLTPYLPEKPLGPAVVVCPGGGYIGTAGDHEGRQVAELLRDAGIAAFVLKYRIPDDRWCSDKSLAPLQDAQQAIRLVRKNAGKWRINPAQIGIIGFSAGGHLAASAAVHAGFKADPTVRDSVSVRPDFVALIYAVVSFSDSLCHSGSRDNLLGKEAGPDRIRFFSNELQVGPQSPPAFLVHAGDDGAVPVENSIAYYQACLKNKIPAEMHLYAGGGHGFGLVNPTSDDRWADRLLNWIRRLPERK